MWFVIQIFQLLVAMSQAALQNQIYVVINIRESMNCMEPQQAEDCPEQIQYYFNTNVVFDRNGAVIDRYIVNLTFIQ